MASSASRELITLQFGPYANHVGAHFWNAQDELMSPAFAAAGGGAELDPGALYCVVEGGGRVGAAPRFTPRVLVFDARGSAGLAQAAAAWLPYAGGGGGADAAGRQPAARRPPPRQHAFQRYLRELESGSVVEPALGGGYSPGGPLEGVTSWGDFSKALLHPRSLVALGSRDASGEQLGGEAAASLTAASAFDAFTMGRGLANEALLDRVRQLLEGCDRPQGVQAVVDVTSGWGGLAEEVLARVREDMPRATLLVLGAAPPAEAGGAGVHGAPDDAAGAFDYSGRSRCSVRSVNLGLAFATFGGPANELGSHFIPLCLQPYADACAAAAASGSGAHLSWFPGLPGRPDPHSDYHTSALLAGGWEGFTSPLRLSGGFRDDEDVLELAAGEEDARGRWQGGAAGGGGSGGPSTRSLGEGADARSSGGSGGGNGSGSRRSHHTFDPDLELAARQPAVGLPRPRSGGGARGGGGGGGGSTVTLGDLLAALTPSPAHVLHTLSLALPFPHPRATATQLHRVLLPPPPLHAAGSGWGGGSARAGDCASSPPIHMAGLDMLAPLSWTSSLPARYYGGGGGCWPEAAAAPPSHDVVRSAQRLQPLAHALLTRGIGSHALAAGRYASSLAAYGRVLDDVLARSGCRQACHGAFRTPLPMPLSFPCALFRAAPPAGGAGGSGGNSGVGGGGDDDQDDSHQGREAGGQGPAYDDAGELVGQAGAAGGGLAGARQVGAGAAPAGMSSVLPMSVPALVYACTGPTYAPALRRVRGDFGARDGSVLHRFAASGACGGGGGVDWAQVDAELADLVDAYAEGQGAM